MSIVPNRDVDLPNITENPRHKLNHRMLIRGAGALQAEYVPIIISSNTNFLGFKIIEDHWYLKEFMGQVKPSPIATLPQTDQESIMARKPGCSAFMTLKLPHVLLSALRRLSSFSCRKSLGLIQVSFIHYVSWIPSVLSESRQRSCNSWTLRRRDVETYSTYTRQATRPFSKVSHLTLQQGTLSISRRTSNECRI